METARRKEGCKEGKQETGSTLGRKSVGDAEVVEMILVILEYVTVAAPVQQGAADTTQAQ